jgi:hypothetical protein
MSHPPAEVVGWHTWADLFKFRSGRGREEVGTLRVYFLGKSMLPNAPEVSDEQLARCRESGDFCPVLFEWYKFTGELCHFFASLRSDSPAIVAPPSRDYAVLIGLLNRISRLMLANVTLSHEGLFGETTAIIDRCIFESAVKGIWLCETPGSDRFDRFVADGLKAELEFKKQLQGNIGDRGKPLVIESRMLDSVDRHIQSSNMVAEDIANTSKLPDLASMIAAVRRHKLLYIVGQKLSSHHVHGTWPSLRVHYLKQVDGLMAPRGHDCGTHVNQYVFVPLIVLDSLRSFVFFVCPGQADREPLIDRLSSVEQAISAINAEVVGNDFERAAGV